MGRARSAKNHLGFTLVELLIVIGIVGVLSSALMMVLNPTEKINQSKDGVRKSDIRQIQAALEMYRSDKGSYPGSAACGSQIDDGGSPAVVYMKKVPCDPVGVSQPYAYTPDGGGSGYTLRACLQNLGDPDKDASNSCGAGRVSYTLTNP